MTFYDVLRVAFKCLAVASWSVPGVEPGSRSGWLMARIPGSAQLGTEVNLEKPSGRNIPNGSLFCGWLCYPLPNPPV